MSQPERSTARKGRKNMTEAQEKARKKKNHKASRMEIQERINLLIHLVIQGYRRREIYHYIAGFDKNGKHNVAWYDISERQLRNYMQEVEEYFRKESDKKHIVELGKAKLQYMNIYRMALQEKEYFPALKARERIDKILGLEAPTKIDLKNYVHIEELLDGLPPDMQEEIRSEFLGESDNM